MTTRAFWKLHGLGNDFIFFDAMEHDLELSAAEVAALCDRHTGIGADGVIVVKPSPRTECIGYMHYINADGTLAQMCGNGARCFAKFLVDHGYIAVESGVNSGRFIADTLSGPKPISFTLDDAGKLATATVDMGEPILHAPRIPTTLEANRIAADLHSFVGEAPLVSPWGTFAFTCVSMGNPHAICFLDDRKIAALPKDCFVAEERSLRTLDVDRIGAFFETHQAFPEKTNVEFALVQDRNNIRMRVFERGCAETHACGTGACATQVAAHLLGLTDTQAKLHLLGGTLHIALEEGHVIMTGPARESFTGTVDPPSLCKERK